MGRVFKPWYYDRQRQRRYVEAWYAEWTDASGATRRKKVGKDKRAALAYLAKVEDAAMRERLGLAPAPSTDARQTPLDTLKTDYLAVLASKDTSAAYRQNVSDHLDRIFAGCSWYLFADMTPDSLLRYLASRRDEHDTGLATLNGYIRSAKGFAKWLAKQLRTTSPLADVSPYPEAVDRRRSKRILTDAEFALLIEAAERCPARGDAAFAGPARAMLYRVAAYTGLRASELATLTPQHFTLDTSPPVVTVAARDAKGKREEPIPLPARLVPILREWFKDKNPTARLWPGRWAEVRQQIQWIKRDVKRAGIAKTDARGRTVTFHSLKRRYVMGLIAAGAKPNELRRLARHRDIRTTLGYYTDENLPDLAKLTDKLP